VILLRPFYLLKLLSHNLLMYIVILQPHWW